MAVPALGERGYWGVLRIADAALGNSSSALIEAPAVDLPAVDVGDRQLGRRHEGNVIHAPARADEIAAALRQALDPDFRAAVRPPTHGRRRVRRAHRPYHRRMAAPRTAAQVPDPDMTPRPLILIGGGEHARVVADAALSSGQWDIVAVVDPAPAAETLTNRLQVVRLGDDAELRELLESFDAPTRPWLVVAVGAVVDGRVRQQVAGRFAEERWASVVHATAWVSPTAVVEPGAVVMACAVVNTGARVGAHAIVNTGAIVEHDVVVGAFTRVGPGATIGGGSVIGSDALLGLGAAVRDHITIGDGATVGMGAVVTAAVAPGATVVGVPARALPRASQQRGA